MYPDEIDRITANLGTLLPLLRPPAAALIRRSGFTSRRVKSGGAMLRVVEGWCAFFNRGCTLHQAGEREGDRFKYKPAACAMFPLARDERRGWYVRQKGLLGEIWDLFCLDPAAATMPAAESLRDEVAFLQRWHGLG